MKRFVAGESRSQATLFPEFLDDFVTEDNPVRAIEAFIDALDLTEEVEQLQSIEIQRTESPDQQISLTDPDARSMTTRGTGIVGYNVQKAVVSQHHLIVAHEVTNVGSDRGQLYRMAKHAMLAASVISTSSLIAVILQVMKFLRVMRPVLRRISLSPKPRRTRPKACFPGKRSNT